MTSLRELTLYLDALLDCRAVKDYCPNGLQVEGRAEVRRVVTGVSASLAMIEAARDAGADALVVHHGLIWGGGIERVTGSQATRLRALLSAEMSLLAYHLPLDRHPTVGNNAGLADAIGIDPNRRRPFGEVRGVAIGCLGELPESTPRDEVVSRIGHAVSGGRVPFVFAHGPTTVKTVALCSGAAGDLIEEASREGADLYLTGELAERAGELARELSITLVAAGHYATEVFGPQRLASELAGRLGPEARFIDIPSPL